MSYSPKPNPQRDHIERALAQHAQGWHHRNPHEDIWVVYDPWYPMKSIAVNFKSKATYSPWLQGEGAEAYHVMSYYLLLLLQEGLEEVG